MNLLDWSAYQFYGCKLSCKNDPQQKVMYPQQMTFDTGNLNAINVIKKVSLTQVSIRYHTIYNWR